MLSSSLFKNQVDNLVLDNISKRGSEFDLKNFIYTQDDFKKKTKELEALQSERNQLSTQIGKNLKDDSKTITLKEKVSIINNKIILVKNEHYLLQKQYQTYLKSLPNILLDEVPPGKNEADNVLVKKSGTIQKFDFTPLTHDVLGEELDIIDFKSGVKIAKSRFSVLKSNAARLERALAQFMLTEHTKNGYIEISPPLLVNRDSMYKAGQLPKFKNELFVTAHDDLFLIPTAEIPLLTMFQDEVLAEDDLPIKVVALTPCFRREAGSYGKDTKGLIRQHQFYKVELVWLCTPETSYDCHQKLLQDAESILQKLGLAYQIQLLCSGDTGFNAAKCFDIEVYLPGQNTYREISSCSNCTDFQARRSNIRYKQKKDNKLNFVHTLNGSALAVGRTLIAVLENCQTKDKKINLPTILKSYIGSEEHINW